MEQVIQPELFDWDDPATFARDKPKKKKRKPVDYEALYKLFLAGPVRFSEIQAAAAVPRHSVAQIITVLSLQYPIYELKRGVYKLYDASDYGDGINREALKEYEDTLS